MTERTVTLRDVAARAGVHPATASRALNPETRLLVREDTARRVLEAAEALGYHPNPVARSLRTRRSNTVGVLIPDLTNPLFPPIVRALEDRLAAAGYVALIGNTDGDGERERLVFQQMRARHVDGMVLATAHLSDPLLADATRAGLPVVLMNRMAQDHSLDSVSVDNERGMRMAVAHLAAEGHRRIAHIAGPQEVSTGLSRYRGFLSAMEAHGLEADPDLIITAKAFSIEEGLRCTRALLERGVGCTLDVLDAKGKPMTNKDQLHDCSHCHTSSLGFVYGVGGCCCGDCGCAGDRGGLVRRGSFGLDCRGSFGGVAGVAGCEGTHRSGRADRHRGVGQARGVGRRWCAERGQVMEKGKARCGALFVLVNRLPSFATGERVTASYGMIRPASPGCRSSFPALAGRTLWFYPLDSVG
jgi:LacI family transcriptional regulator